MQRRMIDQCLERFSSAPSITSLMASITRKNEYQVVENMHGGSSSALVCLIARHTRRPILLLTSSLERAEALTDGLEFFGARAFIFPGFETLPFEHAEPVLHITAARQRALAECMFAQAPSSSLPPVLVAPVDALQFRVLPREVLERLFLRIQWGQALDRDELANRLVQMGYTRESLVESPAEFAIRGSIIDVYPPELEWPVRIDLFGHEIDQIRQFDPSTQRSKPCDTEIEAIRIVPAVCHAPKLEHLAAGRDLVSLFDLIDPETLVLLDAPGRIEQRATRFAGIADRHWHDLQHRRNAPALSFWTTHSVKPTDWLLSADELQRHLDGFQRVALADPGGDDEGASACPHFRLEVRSFEAMPAQFATYADLFRDRLRLGDRVMVVCDNRGQVSRLDELLREGEISAADLAGGQSLAGLPGSADDPAGDVLLAVGELHEGFHLPEIGVLVVTDREMFGRYKRRHVYRKATRGRPIANPSEIKRGDFVVHLEHGIGRFEGVRRQRVDGSLIELLELSYQDGDKLLVPVHKLHLVQKYAAGEAQQPDLDKLGSKKWARRRKKSLEAVRKMAGELLEIYARRAASQGAAFGPDTVWQQEFEAAFLYGETPDQLKAIAEVKDDMRRPQPMDRLVCGDVGYGKTEVAIRAAFKALVEGRQVAVLAPTTLLVQQHFTTFRQRFADYPFRVEMLSRFRTSVQQQRTVRDIRSGQVNLVVGTHRLLSRDVRFNDLGLLIVDEEQRFGVTQKERIKSLRANVDIVTLTATPIPRTLHMALAGVRDLSIIETAPADRHPIKTRILHWDRDQIEEAILRELNRGGQVYFVHNRVQNIQEVARTLEQIVPGARIAVAHGQLEERELEHIMLDFIDARYDILLSTTIIENGLDIPNVNTIVINRADTFGLAQLYQLRGRVGRDVRQAYAYLMLPKGQAITAQAVKRLEALEDFTELGMGFSIAMRDMEIRGTGNILGREQHGAITDVGFDLYCRLLEEAVAEMNGRPLEAPWPVEIRWPSDQFLPEDYIPIESQRIRFYKDLAGARDLDQLDLLLEELVDRYGDLPQPAVNLVNIHRLKIAAQAWRIDSIRPASGERVRIVAPVFPTELAAAMSERSDLARRMFSGLKRIGQNIDMHLRDGEELGLEPGPDQVLAILADLMAALPQPQEESIPHASA